MSKTMIDDMLWDIRKALMFWANDDMTSSERHIAPLTWYINTGRASCLFINKLHDANYRLIARDLHQGGSHEEVINRICKRIGFDRNNY